MIKNDYHHLTTTLFKKAAYAFTGTFAGKVSSALAGLIIARSLGVELFGTYSAIWELVLLCAAVTETGLTIGIQRDGAGNRENLPELVGNALFMRGIIGVLALIIGYLFSSKVSQNPVAPYIYFFLSIASVVVFSSEPLFSGLLALGQQKIVAAFDSFRGIAMLLGVTGIMLLKGGVIAIAALQAILYLVTLIFLMVMVYRNFTLKINLSTMWNALRTTFIYGISGQLFSIYSRIPLMMLAALTNDRQVGIFTAAIRIVAIIQVVGAGIYSRAFVPSLFESITISHENFINSCKFMFSYFTLIGALVGITFCVLAEPIILLLMGLEFREAVPILRILSLSTCLSFILYAPDAAMTAGKKNPEKVLFQIVGPVIGFLAGLFFIPRYHVTGAALTQIAIMSILLLLFLAFTIKVKFLQLQTLSQVILPILIVGTCGLIELTFFSKSILALTLIYSGTSLTVLWIWLYKNRSFVSLKPVHKEL